MFLPAAGLVNDIRPHIQPMRKRRQQARGRRGSRRATALVAGACLLLLLAAMPARGEDSSWTGSSACRDCHQTFYRLWATSRHGLAMQPYSADYARDNLTPMTTDITVGDLRYRAETGADAGFVREAGPDGEKRYPILYVLGGKNVCYFLAAIDGGKLQTLPVAYDVRRKEWFDTAASAVRMFPDITDARLRWTERPYTFNTSCFGCHVSQLHKNYDAATDSYRTAWSEPGINCETCHGPGAEHTAAMEAEVAGVPPPAAATRPGPAGSVGAQQSAAKDDTARPQEERREDADAAGEETEAAAASQSRRSADELKIIVTKTMTHEQRNDLCASCHAKMYPLTAAFTPGQRYFDNFGLTTLENPDFYPDGRDLGENYTFTSWRMSPCAISGKIDCVHCHTPSGRFRFADEPDSACLPCHEQRVKNAAAHTHHKEGSKGSRCIDCHMPQSEFARMVRSDHSMLPPTPAATLAFGSPNACTLCHADKDAAWADELVRKWNADDYQAPVLARGRLVEAARKGDWSRLPDILSYLAGDQRDEIVTTSLVRLLAGCNDERKWPVLRRLTSDRSELVRAAAAAALEGNVSDADSSAALLRALGDDLRVVRVAAATSLAAYPRQNLDRPDAERLERAEAEVEAMLASRPDDAVSQYNLGNYLQERGQTSQALAAYERSWTLEPTATMSRVNASVLYAQLGRMDEAEKCLRSALEVEPDSAVANLNLALLVIEQGDRAQGEKLLRAALEADPTLAAAAYNLGILVSERDLAQAVALCRRALELRPDDARYGYTLAYYQRRQGADADAIATLRSVVQRHPGQAESVAMLADLYQRQNRNGDAEAVLRAALTSAELDPRARPVLQKRLDALVGAAPH